MLSASLYQYGLNDYFGLRKHCRSYMQLGLPEKWQEAFTAVALSDHRRQNVCKSARYR